MTAVEWLIARRYLFSRERKTLISLISLISIGGVAVGVAALIIVISVIDGIDDMLFTNISRLSPHVRIRGADGQPLTIDEALLARLNADKQVSIARPVIEKASVLYNETDTQGGGRLVSLVGADEVGPGTLYPDIFNRDTKGTIKIPDGMILIGRPVAAELGLMISCPVQLKSTSPISTMLGPVIRYQPATVMGIYGTLMPDTFDARVVFLPENQLREFYRMPPNSADYIQVMLKDAFAAGRFKSALGLPAASYKVTTWEEENSDFFGALKLERLGLWLILMLVIVVAALNIVGTLILMVIEKTRAVGILRAIGASEGLVARIFLLDGMMIGMLGTLAGAVIGISACLLIPLKDIELPAAVIFNHLPIKIKLATIALVVGSSLVICTLVGLFPARQAAKLNPVEALRYD